MTVTDIPVALAPPPAPALTPRGVIERANGIDLADLRALAALGRSLGADAAANRLVPHVLLPSLLAGAPSGVVTTALGEAGEDLDLTAVTCRLEGDRLSGRKPLVSGALECERALVAARGDGGVVLALVSLDSGGVERRPIRTLGRGGDADVTFAGVVVEEVADP